MFDCSCKHRHFSNTTNLKSAMHHYNQKNRYSIVCYARELNVLKCFALFKRKVFSTRVYILQLCSRMFNNNNANAARLKIGGTFLLQNRGRVVRVVDLELLAPHRTGLESHQGLRIYHVRKLPSP